MSEHLTHIAVYEDVARIVVELGTFPDAFSESLRSQWDAGLLASASRGNHLFAIPFIEKYKGRWEERPGDGTAEIHIAAALGWLLHRAADLQMKPLGWEFERRLARDPTPLDDLSVSDTEFEVFQDAVTFREVYDSGHIQPGSPYSPLSEATLAHEMAPHPAASVVNVEQVERLLAAQVQEGLLQQQRFAESETDLDTWIATFDGRLNGFTEDLEEYITAYDPPSSQSQEHAVKMVYYMDRITWYDAGDEAIRWARALQRGARPPDIDLAEAVIMARTGSQYAQALHKGVQYLQAAADFFEDRISKPAVYDAVENYNPAHRL